MSATVGKLVDSRALLDSLTWMKHFDLTEMSSQSKTFDFVKLPELAPKPRDRGVIEIRGPYYTSTSYGYLRDLPSRTGASM